ncbi:MAG TPA: protein kinase [Gemmataceae bacterium]|nr:protein kinase [Gemmataceae bacterium]
MAIEFQCDAGHRWSGDSTTNCPVCGSETTFALAPSADSPTRTGGDPTAADHAPWAGPPGYVVQGELGRGGMGVVYRGFDSTLKRPVALKVLLGGAHAGSAAEARFKAEALAVAKLQHANVVQVYEVGDSDGLPFMALEFLPGGTLADRLKAGPVFPSQAATIVERVARGVQAAHAQGVVHRDLKPANILFDAAGEPKVADFGLAKRLDDDGSTRTGAILGTPAFMAPEQARGETKAVGPAADVYALGAVLYACLAGRPPFQGTSVTDTMRLVAEADPDPPPGPSDLQAVCLKCLEKDPARRYPTAGALADDLAHFRAGEPVTARRRPAWARALRRAKRYRVPVTVAVAAVLAAVAVIALYPPRPAPPPLPPVAEVPVAPPEPEGPRGVDRVRAAALRMTSANNLRQIAIGVHNFHNIYGGLPAAAIADKSGRPLLSWRVAILPIIDPGLDRLYKQFKLTEPWDSPHNRALVEQMPKVFAMPDAGDPPGHTRYRMIVGPGTLGDPARAKPDTTFGRLGPSLATVTDGTSLTVLFAEAAAAVPWTKPDELEVYPDRPLPGLGGYFQDVFQVAMGDGSVQSVSSRVGDATRRAMFSAWAGDLPGDDWPDGLPVRRAGPVPTQTPPGPVQRPTISKK